MSRKNPSNNAMSLFRGEERKSLIEMISFTSLVFLGVAIMFYVFVLNPPSSDELTTIPESNSFQSETVSQKSHEELRKDWVSFTGEMVAYQDITFDLEMYDSNAKYDFQFGDGDVEHCHSRSITHYYTKPGEYTVTVKVQYEHKEPKIWHKKIKIKPGLPIDSTAYD